LGGPPSAQNPFHFWDPATKKPGLWNLLDYLPFFHIDNGIGGAVQFTGTAFYANHHINDGLCIPFGDGIAFTARYTGSAKNAIFGHNIRHRDLVFFFNE
jgi:hypothetical protein